MITKAHHSPGYLPWLLIMIAAILMALMELAACGTPADATPINGAAEAGSAHAVGISTFPPAITNLY